MDIKNYPYPQQGEYLLNGLQIKQTSHIANELKVDRFSSLEYAIFVATSRPSKHGEHSVRQGEQRNAPALRPAPFISCPLRKRTDWQTLGVIPVTYVDVNVAEGSL